jgi:hypothetical protein
MLWRGRFAPRQHYWSSTFAVGGRDWLKEIGGGKHGLTDYIEPVDEGSEGDTGARSRRCF